jgi:hypothetical protein
MENFNENWAAIKTEGKPSTLELATAIFDTFDRITADQHGLIEAYKRWTELYLDRDNIAGFKPGDETFNFDTGSDLDGRDRQLTWNAIRAAVDAVTANITAREVSPGFQTERGSVDLQNQAMVAEQIVRGILNTQDSYRWERKAVKSAAILGLGPIKVTEVADKVAINYIHPSRIRVDAVAAVDGKPGDLFHEEFIDRRLLIEDYPGREDLIKNAAPWASHNTTYNQIRVIEAWDLARGKRKGRRVVAIAEGVLADEPWEYDRFPFEFMRWGEGLTGWHGLSGVREVEGPQTELNDVLGVIRDNAHWFGQPFLWTDVAADIREADIATNKRFKRIEGAGQPPAVITPPFINAQFFEWAEQNWNRVFELFGVSQLTATSAKPPGLRSGTALRAYHDIGAKRFADVSIQYARVKQGLGWQVVRVLRDLAKRGIDTQLLVPGGIESGVRVVKRVKWSGFDLTDDQFVMTIAPVAALPDEPAGKRAELVEAIQGGLIDRDEARQLLAWPDLAKASRLETAAREDLQHAAEFMLIEGEFLEPTEHQDLQLGLKIMSSYLLRAKMNGTEDDRLGLLKQWIAEAVRLLDIGQEAEAPAPDLGALPADPGAALALTQAAATAGNAATPPARAAPALPEGV